MSRALEVADLDAAKSKIELKFVGNQPILEATDFSILYRNFSGDENNGFNKDHVRSFNIVLTPEQIAYLSEIQNEYGYLFNVRTKNIYSEEDVKRGVEQKTAHFINVKVKYFEDDESRDPIIELYTPDRNNHDIDPETGKYQKLNKSRLNVKTVGMLDRTDMKRWDAQFTIYKSNNKFRKSANGNEFCTLYLRKLKAVASYEEEFGNYYDDFDEKPGSQIETATEVLEREYVVNTATGE